MAKPTDLQRYMGLLQLQQRGSLNEQQTLALAELSNRFMAKGGQFAKVAEPAMAMFSGMFAEPIAGIAGLTMLPYGVDKATQTVKNIQDKLTYTPRTEAGQQGAQAVGEFMQPVANVIEKVTQGAGDITYDATGSPLLGAMAKGLVTAAPDILGLGIAKKAGAFKGMTQYEMGDIAEFTKGYGSGNQRGMFAGIKAKNADLDALEKAKAMLKDGADRDQIWTDTGWMKDVDDNWKFEISDDPWSGVDIRADQAKALNDRSVSTSALLDHPELYGAYNQIEGIPISKQAEPGGSFMPNELGGEITAHVGDVENSGAAITNLKSTTLHEVQHAVQEREGFARGGSPEQFVVPYSSVEPLYEAGGKLVSLQLDALRKNKSIAEMANAALANNTKRVSE